MALVEDVEASEGHEKKGPRTLVRTLTLKQR